MERTIHVLVDGKQIDFQVDGLDLEWDSRNTPFYALQAIDRDHDNAKYCMVVREDHPDVLVQVLVYRPIIGAPRIKIRHDGSALVVGGGHDGTIKIGPDIPSWVKPAPTPTGTH